MTAHLDEEYSADYADYKNKGGGVISSAAFHLSDYF